ncbi:MAG: ABC transporter ATP-binding protein [Deltaproteobacteria bacterium]|nr:MAG: ABC transporter ATP-binding protein [Deltaproteobacteria bacterium]
MIQVTNLTRYYGDFPALRDVSFEVQEGQIVGLLGLNGAGKSTTLQMLAGVLSPSAGQVTFDGVDVTDNADDLKSRIGFLPEEPPLYRDMTVSSFLVHCAQLKGMSASEAKGRLPEVLRITGLQDRANQLIGTLSHGFKKRVGISMAVIHNPRLVLLDEPISGLDPRQIKDMRKVIRRLADGRAVIVSSHILSEISKTCDRLVVLHEGKVVASGGQEELMARIDQERLVVTIRGQAEAFVDWLDEQGEVSNFTQRDAPEGLARFDVSLSGDVRESFLPAIAAAGFGLRLVEEPDYDLEEVFLGLTGGKE